MRQMRARLGELRWRWAIAAGLSVAALWLALGAAAGLGMAGRVVLILAGLGAAAAALRVWNLRGAEGAGRGRLQLAWAFVGLALIWWALGHLLVVVLGPEAVLARPTVADLARLAGWACAIAAMAVYPRPREAHLGRLRITLDVLVTAIAALTLGWLMLARPMAEAMGGGLQAGWAIGHLLADLVLLIAVTSVYLVAPTGAQEAPLVVLGAGAAAFVAADAAEGRALAQGLATAAAANLGWLAGLLLMGLAAWVQRRQLLHGLAQTGSERSRRVLGVMKLALPLAATFGVSWFVLLDIRNTGQPDLLGLSVAVLLALVLVARQGVMAGELELRQYAQLVNSSADPAFVADGDGRLRLVNPALLAATGYAAEALLRQPATMLFAEGVLPLAAGERPGRIFEEGWTGEVAWRRKDGSLFPAHLALRPVPSDYPTRPGLVGTAHDLTAQKQHEASLLAAYEEVAQARQALETLNTHLEAMVDEKTSSLSEAYARLAQQHETLQTLDELKSEFVSLVSHELRAPLTNIAGGIELVLSGGKALAPSPRRALELVQAEITRLTQFVETILDLSALEAGRLPLYPAPLDVRPMLETVLAQFEARPGADRLRLDLPDYLPPALADERALPSVIYHLVDNALKYAPQDEVCVSAAAAAHRLEVSVSDKGPGIPPELVETVFEKFERLNDADNRPVYGHGLGLYMARRLLEAQGGGIQAAARPEGGARLTCWVPIAEATDGE